MCVGGGGGVVSRSEKGTNYCEKSGMATHSLDPTADRTSQSLNLQALSMGKIDLLNYDSQA